MKPGDLVMFRYIDPSFEKPPYPDCQVIVDNRLKRISNKTRPVLIVNIEGIKQKEYTLLDDGLIFKITPNYPIVAQDKCMFVLEKIES